MKFKKDTIIKFIEKDTGYDIEDIQIEGSTIDKYFKIDKNTDIECLMHTYSIKEYVEYNLKSYLFIYKLNYKNLLKYARKNKLNIIDDPH